MIIANPIYDEEYVTDDLHKLDYQSISKNPLVQKIVRRLANAASNEEIRRLMDAEDSFDRIMNKELQEKNDTIEEQAKAIEDLKRALDDMKKQLGGSSSLIKESKKIKDTSSLIKKDLKKF